MRRYLGRMLVVLTLIAPMLVVLTYQWAPRRPARDADEVVAMVLTAAAAEAPAVSSVTTMSQPRELLEADTAHAEIVVPSALLEPPAAVVPAAVTEAMLHPSPDASRPVLWYQSAATEYGVSPHLLEALHQIESGAAPDGCWPNAEGSGAVGPFQFKAATFQSYGIDANEDGAVDICGFADSLFAAARYLSALGADGEVEGPQIRDALDRYGTDTDRVIDLARYYRAREQMTAQALR